MPIRSTKEVTTTGPRPREEGLRCSHHARTGGRAGRPTAQGLSGEEHCPPYRRWCRASQRAPSRLPPPFASGWRGEIFGRRQGCSSARRSSSPTIRSCRGIDQGAGGAPPRSLARKIRGRLWLVKSSGSRFGGRIGGRSFARLRSEAAKSLELFGRSGRI
jgi:hypothetical protein